MDLFETEGTPRIALILAGIFMVVVVGGIIDLIMDRPTTLFSLHVAFEVLMVSVSLAAAGYLGRRWYVTEQTLEKTSRESDRLLHERAAWEERAATALSGMSEAISHQFEEWELTPAERRTALNLLKGLSHKRIAGLTGTSERTVRQHSVAIYRKSGLGGRAALAGFFLESLLLPEESVAEKQ